MSGTATKFYVTLHCCHWTRVPALGTPNADSGTLAHLVGLRPLDEEVDALSGQVDVSTGRMEPRVKSTETKEPKGREHQTIMFFFSGCDPAFPESVAVVWA